MKQIKITTWVMISSQLFISLFACGQTKNNSSLSFSGYVEVYYTYNINNSSSHTDPGFIYSFNKMNEFALNLGYIKASYQGQEVRANFAIAAGTYMNANYAGENGTLKNIYEEDAGVKISRKKELWIDVGILPSHIGYASAVGMDCWALTRSIQGDNSPFFETGARISYTSNNKRWYMAALLLNGWQRIEMNEGNTIPSFGHQLIFKPNDKLTLNSSSFVGNDQPDSARKWRFFHDLYMQYQITKQFGLIAAFDIGAEQKAKESKSYNCWYSPVIIGKLALSNKSSFTMRAEYYRDKNDVIINEVMPNGFQTFGYSINYDLKMKDNILWRIEAKDLSIKDKIFIDHTTPKRNDLLFTTSLAVEF